MFLYLKVIKNDSDKFALVLKKVLTCFCFLVGDLLEACEHARIQTPTCSSGFKHR